MVLRHLKKLRNVKRKHWLILAGLILFVVAWSILLYFISPQELVEEIGVGQSYLAMFLIAVFGGVSTFTATSYLIALTTFSAGGLHPLLLGLIAGTGLTISDSFFFYLGTKGRKVVSGKPEDWANRFEKWMRRRPDWFAPVITYVYAGLTPLPNDVLTVGLAFAEIEYKRIIIPLWLGNMTLTVIGAYLAIAGVNFLM
jgi:hypothetical protein